MNAKEKAKDLLEKFDIQIFTPEKGWFRDDEQTKQCALIAVDEILEALRGSAASNSSDYWKQVKTELTNL